MRWPIAPRHRKLPYLLVALAAVAGLTALVPAVSDSQAKVAGAPGVVPLERRAATLTCARQRATLRLCGARTDNYKDCYNTPDGRREARSWLSFGQISVRGTRYVKVKGTPQFADAVALRRAGGSRRMPSAAYVTVRARTGNVALLNLRTGPPSHLWGPLLELDDPALLATRSVRIELRLHAPNGRVMARSAASYRRDRRIASVSSASPEHGGPGGRWYVDGQRTATDVELGARHDCG